MQIENFIDIPGYEGRYQVSNTGKVKSLPKKGGSKRNKILSANLDSRGYYNVKLYDNNKQKKTFNIHKLMAIAFLNHTPDGHKIVVDHINNIRTDNRIENLQLISNRLNASKDVKGVSSKYTGVCFCKRTKKWIAQIQVKGNREHLGRFEKEQNAHLAYQNRLKEIE